MSESTIEEFYVEDRTFPPDADFVKKALINDSSHHEEAISDYEAFWARQARELISWDEDFHTTLEWKLPWQQRKEFQLFALKEMKDLYWCPVRF